MTRWWDNFNDPLLARLESQALQANTTVQIAQAALRRARAMRDVAAGGLLPSVDDAGITTTVKSRMFEDKTVSGLSISVETLNGTVQLSGFAKTYTEKMQAETIARGVNNVKSVRNDIIVRPL